MSKYSELIKNYNKIRDYMRDFYVYGFRSRENYFNNGEKQQGKSSRSYDNEKRRIESYLSDIVSFRNEDDGKKVFLTVDSSEFSSNPFYKPFKTKSFTKNDITLHFALLYILQKYGKMTLSEIEEKILSDILSFFENKDIIDTATIRNKLKEYVELGIINTEKDNSKTYFSINKTPSTAELFDALCFFSESFPLGVIGSYVLDRADGENNRRFTFKHKYLLDVVDSEMIYSLLVAIEKRETVKISSYNYRKKSIRETEIAPLKIAITAQSGRNYLMCYSYGSKMLTSVRIDSILSLKNTGNVIMNFEEVKAELEQKLQNTWGVYINNASKLEWLRMYINIADNEQYIINRIQKEGRHGKLEKVSDGLYCFYIESYDLEEMRPWLRTFIGRIEKWSVHKIIMLIIFSRTLRQ